MNHLSTLQLHRLRYNELDRAMHANVLAHLAECPECEQRLQAQQDHQAAFAQAPIPEAMRSHRSRPGRWFWVPVVALAAAALIMVQPPQQDVRTKGLDSIVLHLEGIGPIASGQTIVSGDRLRVSIPPGAWTRAWVSDGEQVLGGFETSVEGHTVSPFSIEVDDEDTVAETLLVILASQPLSDDQLKEITAGHRMNGVSVTSIDLPRVR